MQLDAVTLARRKHDDVAAFYLLLSVGVGLLTASVGAALARIQG